MKIQFGSITPGESARSMLCTFFGLAFLVTALATLRPFNECYKSNVHSQTFNLTASIEYNSFCTVDYEKCLCSVLSNKTKNSTKCITNMEFQCSRILPLVSFLLQICILRDLFTLSEGSDRQFVYTGWIISLLTFIGLAIGIYWNSCYQYNIAAALFFPWVLISFLTAYDQVKSQIRERDLEQEEIGRQRERSFMYAYNLGRNSREARSWQEIL